MSQYFQLKLFKKTFEFAFKTVKVGVRTITA